MVKAVKKKKKTTKKTVKPKIKKKTTRPKVVKKKTVKPKIVKKTTKHKIKKEVTFTEGIVFPWNRAKGLLNIFWALIPILGWFALFGYVKKITVHIVNGNLELPKFGGFFNNLKIGFIMFVKLIPLWVLIYIVNLIPFIGPAVSLFLWIFYLPLLVINLFVKEKFMATMSFGKVTDMVFGHLGDYIIVFLKTFIFSLIYGILSIVLIGIPCRLFGRRVYFADFYRRRQ